MERAPHSSTSSTPKMERRIIEKIRRNKLKSLYSELYSLLPSYGSKEVMPPVPDQIDEARIYIESLQKKLEMYNEVKEKLLLHGKRPHLSSSSKNETPNNPKSSSNLVITNVEIHGMGPNIDAVYLTGLQEQASFYGIIPLLCHHGFEVVNASFSTNGNSMLQISYEKGGKPTAASKRLKELIYGYFSNSQQEGGGDHEAESSLDLWDFEIDPDILNSQLLQSFVFCNSSNQVAGLQGDFYLN